MNERGISPPPKLENWIDVSGNLTDEAWKWQSRVYSNYPKVQTFDIAFNPANVVANDESTQTITVTGVETTDRVIVNKPTKTAGLSILDAFVSAADTVSVTFRNFTGSDINPTSETYRIVAIRL